MMHHFNWLVGNVNCPDSREKTLKLLLEWDFVQTLIHWMENVGHMTPENPCHQTVFFWALWVSLSSQSTMANNEKHRGNEISNDIKTETQTMDHWMSWATIMMLQQQHCEQKVDWDFFGKIVMQHWEHCKTCENQHTIWVEKVQCPKHLLESRCVQSKKF